MSGPRQRKKPRQRRHRFSRGETRLRQPNGEGFRWASPYAFGYRFDTPDQTIVTSGDTSPDGAIPQKSQACDAPIHEVYTQASFENASPAWKQYRLAYHPCSKDLAEIAPKAQPGWLILYHRGGIPAALRRAPDQCRQAGSEEHLLKEVRQAYRGKVVAGHDLEIYRCAVMALVSNAIPNNVLRPVIIPRRKSWPRNLR
jgi:ribonuclease BN (tRNA processing enzyme)